MTNEEYRASRGTDKPFDPSKAEAAWYAMNKEAIDRRRKAEKRAGGKRRRWTSDLGLSPEDYEVAED